MRERFITIDRRAGPKELFVLVHFRERSNVELAEWDAVALLGPYWSTSFG
jgi:hypothetical protein